ncbi:hypothetical protein [Streptomyces chartreusis]
MTTDQASRRVSTVMHVRCPDRLPEETYRQVLELLAELSPVVQALPPSAALVELKGALRYHGTDGRHLGEILRVRALSRLGVDVRVGIGPSITVAATASAQVPQPGGVLAVEPGEAGAWLAPLPVDALQGIGPARPKRCTTTAFTAWACSRPCHRRRCSACWAAAPAAPRPTAPAEPTRAPSSLATCLRPRLSAGDLPGTPWTAPTPAPPCSTWWSASGSCCAAATRRPALSPSP